jgi:hypothetical protein
MKWFVSRASFVLVVMAGSLIAFWAGTSQAQSPSSGALAKARASSAVSASKRWEPSEGFVVKAFPWQVVLETELTAPKAGKVLVTADATFRPHAMEWAAIDVALVQGGVTVEVPAGHWSYCGSEGTHFTNVAFTAILDVPTGGAWKVQLRSHAANIATVHTCHVSAVYVAG